MQTWLIAVIVLCCIVAVCAIVIPLVIIYWPSSALTPTPLQCIIGSFELDSTTEGTRPSFGSVAKFTDSSLYVLDSGNFYTDGAVLYKYESDPSLILSSVSDTQFDTLVSNVSNAFVSGTPNCMDATGNLFVIGLPSSDYIGAANTYINKGLVVTISEGSLLTTLVVQPPAPNNNIGFGSGVQIKDSSTIYVGQSYYGDDRKTGVVYGVKKSSDGEWSNFYSTFIPENNSTFFGSSFAFSSETDTLVIGPDNIAIYDEEKLTQTIKSGEVGDSKAAYGSAMVLTENGLNLLISNSLANVGSVTFAGAVEVWTRSQLGSSFILDRTITSPNPESNGYFGKSLSLTEDRLFIGGTNNVFIYVGTTDWIYASAIQENQLNFAINVASKKRTNFEQLIICSPSPVIGNGSFSYYVGNCIV